MGRKFYEKLNRYMHSHKMASHMVIMTDRLITLAAVISYPLFLMYMYFVKQDFQLRLLAVPALSFAVVSLVRAALPFERPYEMYDVIPLNSKKKERQAMPSRHTFSIFMLAETYLYAFCDPLAAFFYLAGLLLAACRVMMGVHVIRDVAAGCAVALLCGLLYHVV